MGDSAWLTVFERFPDGRVPLTRSVGVFVRNWAQPAEGHPRLFDREWLERLTSAKARVVAAVYLGLAALVLGLGVASALSPAAMIVLALFGVATWTLVEYLLHRFVFHFVPRSRLGVALAYLAHGVHHAYPRDPDRLVLPLVVSVPVGTALFVVGSLAFGRYAWPFLGGFALGYLAYDLIHHHVHRHDPARGAFRWLRRYHLRHHYAAPDRQFGVSTPVWDYVFRTGR